MTERVMADHDNVRKAIAYLHLVQAEQRGRLYDDEHKQIDWVIATLERLIAGGRRD